MRSEETNQSMRGEAGSDDHNLGVLQVLHITGQIVGVEVDVKGVTTIRVFAQESSGLWAAFVKVRRIVDLRAVFRGKLEVGSCVDITIWV